MKELAPIVLFVYNRLDHTIETINALKNNYLAEKSMLYIYSDAPKNKRDIESVSAVRNYINKTIGFKKIVVIERMNNWGLANSIIDGVTTIISKYGNIIVLEDDLVTSKYFLTFLNESLNEHLNNKSIMSIAGYSFPIEIPKNYNYDVYIFYRCMSWGWATWKDRWENVDWETKNIIKTINNDKFKKEFSRGGEDLYPMLIRQLKGKVNSWAIRWCLHHYYNNSACLYPVKSYVKNIGFDGSGIHCGVDPTFERILVEDKKIKVKFDNEFNKKIVYEIQKIHLSKGIFEKVYLKLKKYFQKYFEL